MVSGTAATAVSRWRQNCAVPERAEPRPRTRRSGVRMVISCTPSPRTTHHHEPEHPHEHREEHRTDERGAREPFAFHRAESVTGVPYQMTDAAERVVDQRPGVAE